MQKRILLLLIAVCLSGCASGQFPDGVYGCIDVEGRFTDTEGRLLKLPTGTEISESLISSLCPHG